MLALAVPPLRHRDSAPRLSSSSSSSSAARSRQQTAPTPAQIRRPLPHSRSHPADQAFQSQPRPQRSQSTPQLSAVAQPPVASEPSLSHRVATEKMAAAPQRRGGLDIHAIPPTELLKLLSSLLQHIASANDALCGTPSPPSTSQPPDPRPIWKTLTSASKTAFSTSTAPLSFHARNVPTISLEAYLLRILKYCPISNEVFISLLVYFDRMSRLAMETTGAVFAIDSYNVHRLVIAGVTVSSKFLSDVFYTNTRYAKVGGLPQAELNQLELQFLLLNDFRLMITQEEMQKYGEQLMVYSQNRCQLPLHPEDLRSWLPEPAPSTPVQEQAKWSAPRERTQDDDDDEAVAETYDGGETTDDEPTIRGTHSSQCSETQSIMTMTSEDTTDAESEADDDDVFIAS